MTEVFRRLSLVYTKPSERSVWPDDPAVTFDLQLDVQSVMVLQIDQVAPPSGKTENPFEYTSAF